jgi:hypothetical protein
MDYFSNEYLEFLKNQIIKIKPYLKLIFEQWENSSLDLVKFYPAKKQGYYLVYNHKQLNSMVDPIKEAERLLEKMNQSNKVIFLLGCGNIYLFSNLLKLRDPKQITIIIENNKDILYFLWKTNRDFHRFLLTPNCHIFCSESLFYLWNYLNSLKIEKLKGHLIIKHLPSIMGDSFYIKIEEKIHLLFKSNFSSLLTKFEFETLWFSNLIHNSSYLDKDLFINRLNYYKGYFNSIPFVIVGAGPSLRYSKDILKILQNKSFIFSTDTALKPLLKMGIVPDAVHILDAQIHSYFHFSGLDLSNIILFADLVVHPFLMKKLNPAGWIFSSTIKYHLNYDGKILLEKTKGVSLIEQFLGEIAGIQSGGSVSTSAFEIARYMGAKEFFLIGMDLSWTNRQLHCIDTHHYEKWYNRINRLNSLENINESIFRKRITVSVKGIKNPFTYGDHVLNLYKNWFEETALELKELDQKYHIYNFTYDGAYIENVEYLSINELKNFPKIDKTKINDFKKSLQSISIKKVLHKEIFEVVKQLIQLYKTYYNCDSNKKQEFYLKFKELSIIYPELDVFIHKVDTYIERNLDRLSKERMIHLRYDNLIKELGRFIKYYISFNTSLIHSDVF